MHRDRETTGCEDHVVRLSIEQRDRLKALIQKGKARARQVWKARIVLKADASEGAEGWSDQCIGDALLRHEKSRR